MPQLDPTTFLVQYTCLSFMFFTVYVLLSYVVLPTTLRAIILRTRITSTTSTSAPTLNVGSLRTKTVLDYSSRALALTDGQCFLSKHLTINMASKAYMSLPTYLFYLTLIMPIVENSVPLNSKND